MPTVGRGVLQQCAARPWCAGKNAFARGDDRFQPAAVGHGKCPSITAVGSTGRHKSRRQLYVYSRAGPPSNQKRIAGL